MKKLFFYPLVAVFTVSILSCESTSVNDETGIELTELQGIDKDQAEEANDRDDE